MWYLPEVNITIKMMINHSKSLDFWSTLFSDPYGWPMTARSIPHEKSCSC